jgi:hypothetical protein
MSRPKKASRFRIYDGQNSTKMILRCSDSVGAHCGSAFQLLQGARLFVSDLYFNGVIRSVGAVIKRAPSLEKTYVQAQFLTTEKRFLRPLRNNM